MGTTQLDESSRGHDYALIPKEPGLDRRGDFGNFCHATKGIARSGRSRLLALVSILVGEIVYCMHGFRLEEKLANGQ